MCTVCQFSDKFQYTLNTWTEYGQNVWPKHVVFMYDESKNTVQLVGGEICVVLYILMLPFLETERNCKTYDTWESKDRISTTRLLMK